VTTYAVIFMSSFSTMKVMTLVALFFAGVLTSPPSDKDSRLEGKRLIQFTEEGPAVWLTPLEVDVVSIQDINFMDVTDIQSFVGLSPPQLFGKPKMMISVNYEHEKNLRFSSFP